MIGVGAVIAEGVAGAMHHILCLSVFLCAGWGQDSLPRLRIQDDDARPLHPDGALRESEMTVAFRPRDISRRITPSETLP